MQEYRYPGTRSFSVKDRNLFFGRNEDIVNLSNKISLENIVVLFGKSGLGKTSLLNAGVIPYLKENGNYEMFSIRFGTCIPDNPLTPIDIFKSSLQTSNNQNNFIYDKLISKTQISRHQLWYSFKNLQFSKTENPCFIILLDQFEELFTYPDNQIEQFKKEFSELLNVKLPQQVRNILYDKLLINKEYLTKEETALLYKSLNIKIVFSIRSDRMNYLNRMTDYLPNILKKCYELQPLTNEQAISAIIEPAKSHDNSFISNRFLYDNLAVNDIIDFLSKNGQQKIEPFLLQIFCEYVEKIVIANKLNFVNRCDLGDLQNISQNFYDNIISQLKTEEQALARILIEDGLIFEEDERRLSIYEGQINKQYKISKELLQKLVKLHILCEEPYHRGGFSYELSHDAFIPPILKSKNIRKLNEKSIDEQNRLNQENLDKYNALKEKQKKFIQKIIVGFAICLILFFSTVTVLIYKQKSNVENLLIKEKQHVNKLEQLEKQRKADSLNIVNLRFEKYQKEANQLFEQQKYEDAILKIDTAFTFKRDSGLIIKQQKAKLFLIQQREKQKSEFDGLIQKGDNLQSKGIEFYYQAKLLYIKARELNIFNSIVNPKINELDKKNEINFNSLKERGIVFYDAKGYEDALKEFKNAQKLKPNDEYINKIVHECELKLKLK